MQRLGERSNYTAARVYNAALNFTAAVMLILDRKGTLAAGQLLENAHALHSVSVVSLWVTHTTQRKAGTHFIPWDGD